MGKLSKAKNLTNVEKYSIEGMLANGMKPEAIAEALGRNHDLVLAFVDSYNKKDIKIANKTRSGKSGVSIMTEAASQAIDSTKPSRTATKSRSSAIHTIHE